MHTTYNNNNKTRQGRRKQQQQQQSLASSRSSLVRSMQTASNINMSTICRSATWRCMHNRCTTPRRRTTPTITFRSTLSAVVVIVVVLLLALSVSSTISSSSSISSAPSLPALSSTLGDNDNDAAGAGISANPSQATNVAGNNNISPSIGGSSNTNINSNSSIAAQQQQQQQQVNHPNPTLNPKPSKSNLNPVYSQDVNIEPFMTSLCGGNMSMPLGMQSGEIDDQSLTASSAHNYQSVGPHLARLNQEISGGAWCPRQQISAANYGHEWIQVELNRSHVISAIETQGRYGGGLGVEYVSMYQIEYSRDRGNTWHRYRDYTSNYLLKGNDNAFAVNRNELRPPIVGANVIKILPYSQHVRTVCMRFELYGCAYDDGAPIAYTMIDGARDSRLGRLHDATYDGRHEQGRVLSGLGQLTDGVRGADHYKVNEAFEWIGWHRGQTSTSPIAANQEAVSDNANQEPSTSEVDDEIVIEFEFDTVRNFSGARFFSNNQFSSNIEVFSSVEIHYGIDVAASLAPIDYELARRRQRAAQAEAAALAAADDAESKESEQPSETAPVAAELRAARQINTNERVLWSSHVDTIDYMPDRVLENARDVVVHLNRDRLANRLRFVLKFAAKWILVSEVEFSSDPVDLLQLSATGDLSSIAEHTQQSVLDVLATCTSYDEYMAQLRTHQLRHKAAMAFSVDWANTPLSGNPVSRPKPTRPPLSQIRATNNANNVAINNINWPPPPPPLSNSQQPSQQQPTQRPSSSRSSTSTSPSLSAGKSTQSSEAVLNLPNESTSSNQRAKSFNGVNNNNARLWLIASVTVALILMLATLYRRRCWHQQQQHRKPMPPSVHSLGVHHKSPTNLVAGMSSVFAANNGTTNTGGRGSLSSGGATGGYAGIFSATGHSMPPLSPLHSSTSSRQPSLWRRLTDRWLGSGWPLRNHSSGTTSCAHHHTLSHQSQHVQHQQMLCCTLDVDNRGRGAKLTEAGATQILVSMDKPTNVTRTPIFSHRPDYGMHVYDGLNSAHYSLIMGPENATLNHHNHHNPHNSHISQHNLQQQQQHLHQQQYNNLSSEQQMPMINNGERQTAGNAAYSGSMCANSQEPLYYEPTSAVSSSSTGSVEPTTNSSSLISGAAVAPIVRSQGLNCQTPQATNYHHQKHQQQQHQQSLLIDRY